MPNISLSLVPNISRHMTCQRYVLRRVCRPSSSRVISLLHIGLLPTDVEVWSIVFEAPALLYVLRSVCRPSSSQLRLRMLLVCITSMLPRFISTLPCLFGRHSKLVLRGDSVLSPTVRCLRYASRFVDQILRYELFPSTPCFHPDFVVP